MEELLRVGADALRKAALNTEIKDYVLNNEVLFSVLKKAADRYIGGETLEETIAKVLLHNAKGFKCSVEFMGENTKTAAEADAATSEFLRIVSQTKLHNLNTTISLDLSHIGLTISKELCQHNLYLICKAAEDNHLEVIISAEGPEATTDILDMYKSTHQRFKNIGITLQAYLHRTADDLRELQNLNGRIRLVKGAFATPPGISIPCGKQLDEKYLSYATALLGVGHKCSIATHDAGIQESVRQLIEQYKPPRDTYEFESLFGIGTSQLNALKESGYPVKMYFVYGREWYLYLCNRLAEYPLNLFRAVDDMLSA